MTEQKKESTKTIPGFSQGVRENAAIRMLKMAQPICPKSRMKMTTTPEGRIVPSREPMSSDEQNCQLAGGAWWEMCESKGHDPYWTERRWYSKEDKLAPDPDDPEVLTKVGERVIPHVDRYPNISQVAINVRVNSGQGAVKAQQRKGFKRLSELGFEEVCQFRNCQKPINPKARSAAYGDYCSPAHLQLVAADQQGIFLTRVGTGLAPELESRVAQKRAAQLREAAAFAADA